MEEDRERARARERGAKVKIRKKASGEGPKQQAVSAAGGSRAARAALCGVGALPHANSGEAEQKQ